MLSSGILLTWCRNFWSGSCFSSFSFSGALAEWKGRRRCGGRKSPEQRNLHIETLDLVSGPVPQQRSVWRKLWDVRCMGQPHRWTSANCFSGCLKSTTDRLPTSDFSFNVSRVSRLLVSRTRDQSFDARFMIGRSSLGLRGTAEYPVSRARELDLEPQIEVLESAVWIPIRLPFPDGIPPLWTCAGDRLGHCLRKEPPTVRKPVQHHGRL